MNTVPNKTARAIILSIILLVFLGTTVYVAITKEHNKLIGKKIEDIYYDEIYNDKYDDDYDNNYDDYDDTDEDYNSEDDYYSEDTILENDSFIVTYLYDYIRLYPHINGLKDSFKVSDLTEEEKMKLVAASLKSNNSQTKKPEKDVDEKTININGKVYTSTTPNIMYNYFDVTMIYSDIFGSSANMNDSVLMYDGDNVIYKYNKEAIGYIKYVSGNNIETSKEKPEIIKAERKNKKVELTLKTGTKTEVYIFEPKEGYTMLYKFIERKLEQTKNSL